MHQGGHLKTKKVWLPVFFSWVPGGCGYIPANLTGLYVLIHPVATSLTIWTIELIAIYWGNHVNETCQSLYKHCYWPNILYQNSYSCWKNTSLVLDQLQLVPSGGDTSSRRDQHGTNIFGNLHPGPITSVSNYGASFLGQTTIRTRQILLGFYLSVQITTGSQFMTHDWELLVCMESQ
jgi:hypothetical protein